jgi:tetratricopeptide (TPR) repeat protein
MKKITFIIIISVLIASCTDKKEEKSKMISKISAMETKLSESLKNQRIDQTLVRDLAQEYQKFANSFPSDTNSPAMIYKAAVINLKYIADQQKAIDLFLKLKEKYPRFRETPMALYTTAYIYNDLMKNPEKAKECYELLIEDYPDHYLTKEAKVLIQFVGKSDEQLLNAIIGKTVDTSKPSEEKEK